MLFPFSHGIEPNRLDRATKGMDLDEYEKFVHDNWGEDEPEEDSDDWDMFDDEEDYDDEEGD